MRRFATTIVLLGWLATLAGARAAENLTIDAFYGEWQGMGVAKNPESLYFGETVRDFDVKIGPSGQGFSLTWTTVLRQGGDPNNPNVERKSATVDFGPSAKGQYWAAKDTGDPLSGEAATWARVAGNTLSVYILSVDETGEPNLQIYARTLTAPGMALKFTRIRGDAPSRTVEGRLVKIAD